MTHSYTEMKETWRVATLLMLQWLEVTATVSVVSAQRLSSPSVLPTLHTHVGQTRHALHYLGMKHNLDHEDASLSAALQTLVTRHLAHCSLVITADRAYLSSLTLHTLGRLPNQKQVSYHVENLLGHLCYYSTP